jgi:hydrogenase nickel incorporation protein HypA/HybF
MHELALAQSVIELCEERSRLDAFSRVRCVRLAIGALSPVDPRALATSFEAAQKGTLAEGAQLSIEDRPGRGHCLGCDRTVTIAARGEPCPLCGDLRLLVVGGEEMRILSLEVE